MPQIDLGKIVGDTGPQGLRGLQGNPGEKGETGSPGPGVAVGGAANQVLVKHSGTNFDTMWVDAGSLPVFAGVQYAVAIVADGNTHPAIADGQFVYVRNHSTLAEGLYKATAAIGTNVALTTSNLTADSAGGLNDLQAQVNTLNGNISSLIVSEERAISNSESVTAGNTRRFDVPIEKTGYTPVGIAWITGSGTTGLVVQEYSITNEKNYSRVYYRNISDQTVTPTRIEVGVLYVKNIT